MGTLKLASGKVTGITTIQYIHPTDQSLATTEDIVTDNAEQLEERLFELGLEFDGPELYAVGTDSTNSQPVAIILDENNSYPDSFFNF